MDVAYSYLCHMNISAAIHNTGPWLVRVQRVQLHPLIFGNRCMNPSIFRAATSITIFCQPFPANFQILHPSIEISNKGTGFPCLCTYLLLMERGNVISTYLPCTFDIAINNAIVTLAIPCPGVSHLGQETAPESISRTHKPCI